MRLATYSVWAIVFIGVIIFLTGCDRELKVTQAEIELASCFCKKNASELDQVVKNLKRIDFICTVKNKNGETEFKRQWIWDDSYVAGCTK